MKVIKDLVHGYVEIDDFEQSIIDTSNFQRLRDIQQLTAQRVYPSATHNRFEHSLGVMYLAKKALTSLNDILKRKYEVNDVDFLRLLRNLSVASLLHDIGHAPFSHLGEIYYRSNEIKMEIKKALDKNEINMNMNIFTKGSKHELMSCYVILSKYINLFPQSPEELDIELICRCIVGNLYDSNIKWKENLIVEILNSNTIDTDKLDYLMRDAYMTGISVPTIDTNRLFRSINIHPTSRKITFNDKALPVIQNIIDSRDALYLWVYNHHIPVYTDFLIDYFIKHMIRNFEEGKSEDQLDPNKVFSCNAVSNLLASDSDLWVSLKETKSLIETGKSSVYTQKLFPQLFERGYLKPLWKSIYDYKMFLEKNIEDEGLINDLTIKLCDKDYKYRRYVVNKILEKCNLQGGDVFIIPRSNKFYSLNVKNTFQVYYHNNNININKLLPQKDFKALYQDIGFYVFGTGMSLEKIREAFIEISKQQLPDIDELEKGAIYLKWFEGEDEKR